MRITLDKRYNVVDPDPALNFKITPGDTQDYNITLRGFKQPVLEVMGLTQLQLLTLRKEIDNILDINDVVSQQKIDEILNEQPKETE